MYWQEFVPNSFVSDSGDSG